jgi:hypothetical protein
MGAQGAILLEPKSATIIRVSQALLKLAMEVVGETLAEEKRKCAPSSGPSSSAR